MLIDHDSFIDWAESHFASVKVSGDEVKVPDIWNSSIDTENKCWVNTKKCCYRAFKSERTGHLIELVMDLEGCDWETALDILGGEDSLASLNKKMLELFGQAEVVQTESIKKTLKLPSDTYLISSLLPTHPVRQKAEAYLNGRKINTAGLMVCLYGQYYNRIVIPYYDKDGKLIYFNTRNLSDQGLRYLGPPQKEFGVGKADVIWMSTWPTDGEKLYLCEGEFDAISLAQCGFYSGACGGKVLSEKQIDMLKLYRIVISFDSDKAGKDGIKVADDLRSRGMSVSLIRPPKEFKDWNQLLVEHGTEVIKAYIAKEEKPFNQNTLIISKIAEL